MQYQVNLIHQTEENGQKADFWLFGSFKNEFLNDSLSVKRWPNGVHYLVLSEYAISSQAATTNSRKWQKKLIFGYLDHPKCVFPTFE